MKSLLLLAKHVVAERAEDKPDIVDKIGWISVGGMIFLLIIL